MSKTKLTKEEEIKLIQELINGKGYFAEKFGKDRISMERNIRMDYPIENGTFFNDAAEQLEDTYNALKKEEAVTKGLKNRIDRLEFSLALCKNRILKLLNQAVRVKCFKDSFVISENFTSEEILTEKVKLGAGLSDEEKKQVIELIKER